MKVGDGIREFKDLPEVVSVVDSIVSAVSKMRYITTINVTKTQWENEDPAVTTQLIIAYLKLINDNKLNPYEHTAVLGWTYENDDYVQNRITLVLEAQPIADEIIAGNYKDNLK